MVKAIVFVHEAAATSVVDDQRLTEVGLALDEHARSATGQRPEIKGLVLSQIGRRFAADDLLGLVELWLDADADADVDAAVEACVPTAVCNSLALRVSAISTTEIVLRQVTGRATPQSPWRTKLAGTAFRREDFETERFFAYWVDTHAPIGGSVPGIGGYVVSRVRRVVSGDVTADALIEQWYADDAAFDAAQTTEQAQAAWRDVGNYAQTTGTFWLMTENVILAPPESGPGLLEERNG